MEKHKILLTIGFSEEFIKKLEEFEQRCSFEIEHTDFPNEEIEFFSKDSKEFFIQDQDRKTSDRLIIK